MSDQSLRHTEPPRGNAQPLPFRDGSHGTLRSTKGAEDKDRVYNEERAADPIPLTAWNGSEQGVKLETKSEAALMSEASRKRDANILNSLQRDGVHASQKNKTTLSSSITAKVGFVNFCLAARRAMHYFCKNFERKYKDFRTFVAMRMLREKLFSVSTSRPSACPQPHRLSTHSLPFHMRTACSHMQCPILRMPSV
jgi:hypothetical protein